MGATIGLRGCAEFLKGVSVELQLETCYSSKWDVLQMAEAMMSVDGGGPPGLVLGDSTNFLDRHEHLGSEWGPIEACLLYTSDAADEEESVEPRWLRKIARSKL